MRIVSIFSSNSLARKRINVFCNMSKYSLNNQTLDLYKSSHFPLGKKTDSFNLYGAEKMEKELAEISAKWSNLIMKFNIFFFLVGLSVCVPAFVHIAFLCGVSNSLAVLLFGPLLLSSQGPLALSKVVKHENETLVYLTFSFVQMSHSICDALHMFDVRLRSSNQ